MNSDMDPPWKFPSAMPERYVFQVGTGKRKSRKLFPGRNRICSFRDKPEDVHTLHRLPFLLVHHMKRLLIATALMLPGYSYAEDLSCENKLLNCTGDLAWCTDMRLALDRNLTECAVERRELRESLQQCDSDLWQCRDVSARDTIICGNELYLLGEQLKECKAQIATCGDKTEQGKKLKQCNSRLNAATEDYYACRSDLEEVSHENEELEGKVKELEAQIRNLKRKLTRR